MMKCCKYALIEPYKKKIDLLCPFFSSVVICQYNDNEEIFFLFNLFYLQNSPLGMFP